MSPFFVLCDTSILDFLILVDVIWHSLYTISEQFSSCATGIPEISSISLLPYCSSWFLLTFSISNSSWRSFSVLLMKEFSFSRFLFSASILAIWLPWVSSVSAWKSCDFSIYINFFSILSILVARLSTLCCTMSSFSILSSIPSIDDVILVRVAIISFKISSCCFVATQRLDYFDSFYYYDSAALRHPSY